MSQVYREAKRVGAECSLLSKARRYHLCLLQDRSAEFSVGLNHQGDFGIWISSTVVHGLPPTDDSVVSGKYLPEGHRTLEKWALNLVPETTILAAGRRYVGYGVVQDLKNADLQSGEKRRPVWLFQHNRGRGASSAQLPSRSVRLCLTLRDILGQMKLPDKDPWYHPSQNILRVSASVRGEKAP